MTRMQPLSNLVAQLWSAVLLILHIPGLATQTEVIHTALIVVPPLFDEIQVLTMTDVLRRAEVQVSLASMVPGSMEVRGQHGLSIVTDIQLPSSTEPTMDMILIPSGDHTYEYMSADSDLGALLQAYARDRKYIAAMGTGVGVLANRKIYSGSQVTVYPSLESIAAQNFRISGENVVIDGPLFTARASVNALEFALNTVERHAPRNSNERLHSNCMLRRSLISGFEAEEEVRDQSDHTGFSC
ncbi:unnamed protein product [Echinostoma caproni]|uniref:DJ-1_PfpI domain-containing protein n=1 Tax=Echinostoma caproni TaxID=27848 RepID=A0A183A8L3_9TREM|nr:unnamed protein product [Echinostoma caproni]